jgi:3-isopropylmalate/(R)-2-methylmalate dehydratase large subunit
VTRISFNGRLLFLSADADVMDAQLAGRDINLAEAGALRDDISTDEITPLPTLLNFDERLGLDAHTGYKAGNPGQSHFKFERGLWRGMRPSIRPA